MREKIKIVVLGSAIFLAIKLIGLLGLLVLVVLWHGYKKLVKKEDS